MKKNRSHKNWTAHNTNKAKYFDIIEGLISIIPRPVYHVMSFIFMSFSYFIFRKSIRALILNFKVIFPEKNRFELNKMAWKTFINYGQGTLDFLYSKNADISWIDEMTSDMNSLHSTIELLRERNKGFILVTPHLGNWELGGILLTRQGVPLKVLALPEEDEGVDELRNRKRLEAGIETIKVGSNMESLFKVTNALKNGEVIALLCDRYFEKDKVKVDFFGRQSYFLKAPAILAKLSKCPLVPMYITLGKEGKYIGFMDKPIYYEQVGNNEKSLQMVMQKVADSFSNAIYDYPEQWYNFYDYWGR